MSEQVQHAYHLALKDTLIVRHETPGVVELKGKDRIDLLHRLSTNEVEGMQPNQLVRTVFTDPVGRMIDVVTALALVDRILLLTSVGRSEVMRNWLQRHIFFQDDVTVTVREGHWALFGAYGPAATSALPAAEPAPNTLSASDHGVLWSTDRPVAGFLRLVEVDADAVEWQATEGASDAFEILRIEAGIPKMGMEIQEDSIPLEVGLWDEISFEKGCYVGQEIIARMESRGKLAKTLVGIRLESSASPGIKLRSAGQVVGTLTSQVYSPRFGWIALASARPSVLGKQVEIGDGGATGSVVALPFKQVEAAAPA